MDGGCEDGKPWDKSNIQGLLSNTVLVGPEMLGMKVFLSLHVDLERFQFRLSGT